MLLLPDQTRYPLSQLRLLAEQRLLTYMYIVSSHHNAYPLEASICLSFRTCSKSTQKENEASYKTWPYLDDVDLTLVHAHTPSTYACFAVSGFLQRSALFDATSPTRKRYESSFALHNVRQKARGSVSMILDIDTTLSNNFYNILENL